MKAFKLGILAFGMCALPALSAFAQVSVTIDAAKPGPTINKNVYGQFAEHLGTGIYEGLWVGPQSKIPNTRGWRNDVLGALKDLQVPLVRWPGGCFADEYHWRDGIGARNKRPVKVNTHWGGVAETNAVGTHEFFDLAEMLGAQTYVNGNLGSGTPQEMAEWLEYMTSDTKSTLAEQRRKNGRAKPFKVDYFGIGNEAWGCGGNMKPEYYANLYNHYATFLKAPKGARPKLIASGGNDDDTKWTDVLSREAARGTDGISFHFYTLPTGKWDKKGAATGFDETEWASTMKQTLRMETMIRNNVAVLDKNDPKKKIGFYVDEWGTWYDVEPGTDPGFLFQRNSLRDAVVAALNFNIFHAHAERVRMTNIAQMVNVLQAMIITDKDRMLLTPTYHAYKMYIPFQDATSLPAVVANDAGYTLGATSVPGVSVSAARAKDGKLYVALVNTNPRKATDVDLNVAGQAVNAVSGQVLTADAMDAHNTFDNKQAVKPAPYSAKASGGKMTVTLPAKSVMVVAVEG
ncbi:MULTISPECIES: alpha-N-arabinofuranosidase [unclassified Massilia]|uniref:alpha-N-arabinofuranosidase n=1 Tax=unclassified Massilia TaxID=2609279 RepID=UPI0017840192|nr:MULTISPECIES: alpha-L-arabinofuranosidase C-terminal domain-containing protein [unclassified Massilia]MBD8531062.1 alpha-N-arabinofuranosidase [Massilia sp. CFBP 13647]MBD8674762.1 alpha-N-arabinofuranosidase [Massilia sp. CFBP 13721]